MFHSQTIKFRIVLKAVQHVNRGGGVAKPGPTRAWARASVRKTVEHRTFVASIAICNDAVSYTLLTSLFARCRFNTGEEDLYCTHVCRSHGSELYSWFKTDGTWRAQQITVFDNLKRSKVNKAEFQQYTVLTVKLQPWKFVWWWTCFVDLWPLVSSKMVIPLSTEP